MTETTTMATDLDLLAERVEKAAALVQRMRDDKLSLERERDDMERRLRDTEQKLQGQDVAALMTELQGLRKEQREWQAPLGDQLSDRRRERQQHRADPVEREHVDEKG